MSAVPGGSSDRFGKRLESWKEIAGYVNRHVTTVRRWEKQEGLPVHRHVHSTLGSIYAYARELDAWLHSRQPEPLGAPVVEMPARRAARSGHLPPPPSLTSVHPWPVTLLGRADEMETLRKKWTNASRGQQQIVLIAGEAGQGKTRLALEFARWAAQQGTVLTGVWDREALVPFAPFVTMLQWLVRASDGPALERMLKEIRGGRELAQLVPEIGKQAPPGEIEFRASEESRRFRMFEAFAELLIALARDCPMLLLFEDVHWADAGSLLFLRHLIRSTREAAICVMVTLRENEPECSALSEEILQDFRRDFASTRIRLGGLSACDLGRFVESWTRETTPPGLTDWMVNKTEGNPLFLTEVLMHLDETDGYKLLATEGTRAQLRIPEGIRQLIRRRLARLTPASKNLLTLASAIGREFDLQLLEALTDMPEDELLDGMEEAVAGGIITEVPGEPERFSFTHALLRETLYGDIMTARRVRLHHRVAEALERRRSRHEEVALGEIAHHFVAALPRDIEQAIDYSIRAGDEAFERLAPEDAARYYGMALEAMRLLSTGALNNEKLVAVHVSRGRSFFQAGQWAMAKSEFEAALSALNETDAAGRCELLVRLAETSFWLMDVAAMRQFATAGELLAEEIGRDDLWADARAWMASAEVAEGHVLNGIEADRETLARTGGIRSFGLARIPLTLYWAGHTTEAVERAEGAVDAARSSSDSAFLLYALQHLGICLSGAGRYDESLRTFDEACSFGRQCGAFPLLARATSMSVGPLLNLGEFARAEDRAREARELAHRVAFNPPLVSAGIDLLLIHARTNDPGKAEPLLKELEQAVAEARGWHEWKWKMRLSQARAELASARGEWAEAIRFAGEAMEWSKSRNRPKYEALALRVRAQAGHELGMRKAVEDARRAVDVARRLSDPAVLVACLGLLLEQEGTDELLQEFQGAVKRMLAGIKDETLRHSFLARAGKEHYRQQVSVAGL